MTEIVSKNPIKGKIIKSIYEEEWGKNEESLSDKEYVECVEDILQNRLFQSINQYLQHGCTTTLTHCLHVSYLSYRICKRYGLDYVSAARGGLLHDFYLYDWHTYAKETGQHFHGFFHPRIALNNAIQTFQLNEVEKDIILKHMWPLTIIPPKTWEGFVVMYVDKHCGLIETIMRFKKKQTILTNSFSK